MSVDDITTHLARNIEAGRNLAKVMLTRPWADLDCRLDVIGVTRVFRVEMGKSIHVYKLTDLRNRLNNRVFPSGLVIM
jgi:hypothetical protein